MIFQLKTLETLPGSEDAVLKVILDLALVEGISLPSCMPAATSPASSALSLHTAIDANEHAVDATWNQLCVLLRRRFLERLKQIADGPSTGCERRLLVTNLCALSPQAVVASQYQSIRQLQLDSCVSECLCLQGDRMQSFEQSVNGFKDAVNKILAMMSDDVDLLMTGCLTEDLDEAFQLLGDVYFDRVQDEVELLVDKITK